MTLSPVSTIPAFMDAFQEALAARITLTGVQVVSGPLPLDNAALETIQFDGITMTQTVGGLGNSSRDEEYTLTGLIYVAKAGAGETTIRAARSRCYAIFAEIEQALRTDHRISDHVRTAQIAGGQFDQGIAGDGERAARLTWQVSVAARLKTN